MRITIEECVNGYIVWEASYGNEGLYGKRWVAENKEKLSALVLELATTWGDKPGVDKS